MKHRIKMKRPPTVLRFHKLRRLLAKYESHIRDVAFVGAYPPEEVPDIVRDYREAKRNSTMNSIV